jgi:hypothetical protein
MHYQNQNTIAYLESENTPTVNLAAFRGSEKRRKVVKDISSISDRAEQIRQVRKPEPEPVDAAPIKSEVAIDGNIERRVRPLNIDFITKKKNVTWL